MTDERSAVALSVAEKLEIVSTPRHGSWLKVAEVELAVLEKQCIGGRIPDRATLNARMKAWQKPRNRSRAKVDWRFTIHVYLTSGSEILEPPLRHYPEVQGEERRWQARNRGGAMTACQRAEVLAAAPRSGRSRSVFT